MTLCVVAKAFENGNYRTVIAADHSVETEISKAEIENKFMYVGDKEYPVLIAGQHSRADELLNHIADCGNQSKQKVTTPAGFIRLCRQALRRHKNAIADEYVSARLGVSYDDLLRSIHNSIPPETYREIMNDVTRIKLGCELLIVFFDWTTREPSMFRISDDGTIELCFNFAAIGSGIYIAESALFHREHTEETPVAGAIYHVYEAMRLGSHAPGVGERFKMGISYAGKSGQVQWQFVEEEYLDLLESEFKKWGPRPIGVQVLHEELLRTLTFDRQTKKRKRK